MDYTYVAYTEDNKIINGAVGASTEKAASDYLVKQGYRVLSLKTKKPISLDVGKFFSTGSKVKQDAIILFAREMATLIDSGVSVVTALELLQGQSTNERMKKVLINVISDIRSGQRLSDAMSKHSDVFSPLFCRSLSVGEQSAELSIVLNQVADYMEKDSVAKKGIKGALAYPAVIAVVAIAVIARFMAPRGLRRAAARNSCQRSRITSCILIQATTFFSFVISTSRPKRNS